MKTFINLFLIIATVTTINVSAQTNEQANTSDYLQKSWKQVATKMPTDWYGSEEAKLTAENVLLCQKEIGGWAKNKQYHQTLSESDKAQYLEEKEEIGATFDNGSTITELKFLAKVYTHIKDDRYKQAFAKGLD